MLRGTLGTILATAVILNAAVAAYAQQPKSEPPSPTAQKAPNATPEKPAPKPPVPDSATNVKIDLTITDQAGPGEPARRSVSMLVADQRTGSVRSSGQITASGARFNAILNVDALPRIMRDGSILLDLTLEYTPKPGNENANSGEGRGSLNQRLSVKAESGKPTVISQASDPTSDRKMSVEVTATVVK
jgi:glucose/arabinose dehydrogenase